MLEHLLIPKRQGPLPTRDQHNGLVKALMRSRVLGVIPDAGNPDVFRAPWRVQASRFQANTASTLNPDATWRIDVAPGAINDAVPSFTYLRNKDPRGWAVPQGYAENPNALIRDKQTIDRDMLDDIDDPPYLVIPDPKPRVKKSPDWEYIPDTLRPLLAGGALCGADDWQLELWRSHVILSVAPILATVFPPSIPPPKLKQYRIYCEAPLPSQSFGAAAGGWVELATLYMLRDPNAADPVSTAEIRVRQQIWWPLWAVIAQPGQDIATVLANYQGATAFDSTLVGLVSSEFDQDIQSAASVAMWSV